MAKPKILVTGVAGFIGSNLADRLLAEGYPVVGIDNLSYGVAEQIPPGVDFHKIDIRAKEIYPLFEGIDAVFHLAAKNCLPDCQREPVETADINVRGTVNVFEAARRAGVKKVIYAESSALYEDRSLGFYAVSKAACNAFARAFREGYGLTTVGLRYFNVYGPRQDYRRTTPPVMSTLIINLLTGKPVILYDGDNKNARDFVHIDDVNSFHLRCLTDARVDNKVFDIGTGRSFSIAEMYDTIRSLVGVRGEVVTKPRLPDDLPVVTRADSSAARSLGWEPRVDIRQGLSGMIDYIRQEIARGNIE